MADETSQTPSAPDTPERPITAIRIARPVKAVDYTTAGGLVIAIFLVGISIYISGRLNAFYDLPSVLLVFFGTMAITAVSYTGQELQKSMGVLKSTLIKIVRDPERMARQLLDIAVLVRVKGPLALAQIEGELRKDPYLYQTVLFVADGYQPEDIRRILTQDIESLIDRHRRSAGIALRAAQVAPSMGLIGTLIGLVQMLNDLDDPSKIGPSMALALLTTFYGAVMSTVFLMPLAAKLERNSADDVMIKDLILCAVLSMARQDHPRKLENELNTLLPPSSRVRYYS